MTQEEKNKLDKIIEYIEKLEAECIGNYNTEKMDIVKSYYQGAHNNTWLILQKIKEEFNI